MTAEWKPRARHPEVASVGKPIVRALAPLGRREEADEILARLEEESRQHYARSEIMAMGHAAVDSVDRAFEC